MCGKSMLGTIIILTLYLSLNIISSILAVFLYLSQIVKSLHKQAFIALIKKKKKGTIMPR